MDANQTPPFGSSNPPAPHPKWYYNPWFVLLMLFFVLGPFGLPLVWKNPRFARWMKLSLTVLMGLYTWWLIALTIKMVHVAMGHLNDLQSVFP